MARLQRCEDLIAQAGERIAALERASADDARAETNKLLGGMPSMVAEAVRQTLAGGAAPRDAGPSGVSEAVAAHVEDRLGDVLARLDALEAAVPAGADAPSGGDPRVDDLAARVEALEGGSGGGVFAPDIVDRLMAQNNELVSRMDALEDAAPAAASSEPTQLPPDLDARLGTLITQMSEFALRQDTIERRLAAGDVPAAAPAASAGDDEILDFEDGAAPAPAGPAEVAAPARDGAMAGRLDALEQRVNELVMQNRAFAARMDALEKRLDDMQPTFNEKIEKAAAAAVGRLLRDQIALLREDAP